MKKSFLLCLLCLTSLQAFSAFFQKQTDSVYQLMLQEANPPRKLHLIFLFCEDNRTYPYDTFYKYAQQAEALSQRIGTANDQAKAQYYMAVYNFRNSRLDSVDIILKRASGLLQAGPGSHFIKNRIAILKGMLFIKENKCEAAQEIFYDVLAKAGQQKDTASYLLAISGLGWSNLEIGKIEESKRWTLKGISLKLSPQYRRYTVGYYNNIIPSYGIAHQLDSAEYYIDKALEISELTGDLILKANTYNFQSDLFVEKKQYAAAIESVLKAMEVRKIINDPFYEVSDLAQLSLNYAYNKQYDLGIITALRGIEIANKQGAQAKLPLLYTSLHENYERRGDYKNSATTLKKLLTIKDSLYSSISTMNLADMQVKYETAEKEKVIQQQQFALAKKNYWLIGSVATFCLLALVALLGYRSYRHKQDAALQKIQLQQQTVLTESILKAEESERRRIAADLHDGLGQMLTAARYNLTGIADTGRLMEPDDQLVFEKAIALVDESCKEVRNVSHNIMPNALLQKGLSNAVKEFLEKIGSKKIKILFDTEEVSETHLDINTEVIIYRIIQECVNNAIKHSEATQLHLSLIHDDNGLSLSVEDNGKGFVYPTVNKKKGLGLKSIYTRVEYLKGSIEIDTEPGRGALISIHIPLSQESKNVAL